MRLRRFLAILHARNLEFLRDRSSLGWNILLPVLLVVGLGAIFGGTQKALYHVAVYTGGPPVSAFPLAFLDTQYVDFYRVKDLQATLRKVERQQVDLLLDLSRKPYRYWINSTSPKGYILEKVLHANATGEFRKGTVSGHEVRYVDWVLPGILGMNMMFSCLFGIGYVIVRYRKNGFLKRLHATPLSATEFIAAHIASRLILIMSISALVFAGTKFLIGFRMEGSYLALALVAALGAIAMISLGLVIAARVNSEELAGGLLNMVSWPMMLLSGVWFSLEGAHRWVRWTAEIFPLTHLLTAARAIMIDGAGLADVTGQLLILTAMSLVFLAAGAWLFRWRAW
ncbi:MAG: ABC transporter permease [Gammaproteobacteria bacterium]|jgi:ABC-type multidrug transport system permease subunit